VACVLVERKVNSIQVNSTFEIFDIELLCVKHVSKRNCHCDGKTSILHDNHTGYLKTLFLLCCVFLFVGLFLLFCSDVLNTYPGPGIIQLV
jgi:hypothetical protein